MTIEGTAEWSQRSLHLRQRCRHDVMETPGGAVILVVMPCYHTSYHYGTSGIHGGVAVRVACLYYLAIVIRASINQHFEREVMDGYKDSNLINWVHRRTIKKQSSEPDQ